MGELTGRVALVTGSSRNIGRAVVLELARMGADVVINARTDVAGAEAVAAEVRALGVRPIIAMGDVSSRQTVDDIRERALAELGGVDIYVSNVAARPVQSLADTSFGSFFSAVDAQLHASFRLARTLAPGMLEKGWGRVIHITGPSAYLGVANRPHVAGKGGLRGLTKSLAIELGPHGITVNDVAPGEVRKQGSSAGSDGGNPAAAVAGLPAAATPGLARDEPGPRALGRIPVGRTGMPEDVAYACGFLASPRAGFYTGNVIVCSGGQWTAF